MALSEHKLVTVGAGKAYFNVVDEDDMSSDSAIAIPTQQSVKAYVDSVSGALPQKVYLTGVITDISTPASHFVVCPIAGTITKIYSTIDNAITVANAVLSFELAGTAVTGGGITIATASSAAGDVDTATPTAANTVTAGQAIEMITDGGSTTACRATITFEITPA